MLNVVDAARNMGFILRKVESLITVICPYTIRMELKKLMFRKILCIIHNALGCRVENVNVTPESKEKIDIETRVFAKAKTVYNAVRT